MNDELYNEKIMALAQAAGSQIPLDAPDATATADNPLCGDRATVEVSLETPSTVSGNGDRRIVAVAHRTRGCALCQAAANAMANAAPGHTAASVRAAADTLRRMLAEDGAAPDGDWAELGVFAPVRRHRSRHTCVLLPFTALSDALEHAEGDR